MSCSCRIEDIQKLQKSNSQIESLCESDLRKWVCDRNLVIREFLEGIAGKGSTESEVAKTIEHIYHLGNSKAVLPVCLGENLVSYSVSGSRAACEINSANSPAGSYPYLISWLREQSHEPHTFPDGDVLVAFDNDQVIGKTYHVRHNNKVKTSVVTSVCIAEVSPTGTLQADNELKHGHWQTAQRLKEQVPEILAPDSTLNNAVDQTHYKELYATLQTRILKVVEEQRVETTGISDNIDKEVATIRQKREWRVCSECGAKNLKNKRICIACGQRLRSVLDKEEQATIAQFPQKKSDIESSKYVHVKFAGSESQAKRTEQSTSASESPKVNVRAGDPIFVNPNSYQSLITVFKSLGKQAGIKKYAEDGWREWVVVTCDGLPYTLGQRVIKETFTCAYCHAAIFLRESYMEHVQEHYPTGIAEEDLAFSLEFDWLLLKIGHGHVEMNMVRSFLELNWPVFMKDVALCMGFCSEAAQKYAKSGADHHKSWELMQIAFLGSLDELLVPYIREKLAAHSKPTPDDFLLWSGNVKSARYKYLQEQMLTYMQAIFNLRAGIRHNDIARVIAGRVKFAHVFHARNHPKYQAIELTELSNFLAAPNEVKKFLSDFQAISSSGDPTRCEDMDFVLENINKKSKSWIPKGIPTHEDWQRIFRNLSKLDKLRSAVLSRTATSVDLGGTYTSTHNVREVDVAAWRACLRDSEFLLNQDSDVPFQSVSKDELDESLTTFTEQAAKRRRFFAQALFQDERESHDGGEESYAGKPQLVFVTRQEREHHTNICNQTKAVIAKRILDKIGSLDDESIKTLLLHEWDTSVKSGKKDDYIAFFQRLQEEVIHQTPPLTEDLE
ncbi:uncharacterized protein LOC121425250 [Lytechinus variegatus]|uniref:uncharacterized protein LOC121425250 n=1 Tax=Lytechinus variegatus TaxID=7654 RepID=UPI001BB1FA27|nr:uncharacterized protein LOC121425250 [Lytechinus variegatus]